MSKQIKAVFFDLDGTLISFNTRSIPASTAKALDMLKQKGIKIIAATGRSITMLDHVRHLDFDGFITFNGGYCLSKEGELLHRQTIHPDDITRLLNHTVNPFVLMTQSTTMTSQVTRDIELLHEELRLPVPPLIDINKLDISGILQANVFISPEGEQRFMEATMPNCVASRWTPLFMDVNPKAISKKVGIDALCRHFSIDVAETMAFGDGGNDMTMLQHAGIGVAMGNASQRVKDIADYVTDDTDNDGIWNGLQQFGVI
jgi:Cof subfamily protein (haloacid dehalogenase superfamily)